MITLFALFIIFLIFSFCQTIRLIFFARKIDNALREISLKKFDSQYLLSCHDTPEISKQFLSQEIETFDICIDLINENLNSNLFNSFFKSKKGGKNK